MNELRTATVVADEPSVVYCLSKDALAQLETEQPVVAMALHKLLVEQTAKRVKPISDGIKNPL